MEVDLLKKNGHADNVASKRVKLFRDAWPSAIGEKIEWR